MSRTIDKEVFVNQPPDVVWKALTEATELIRWFPVDARVEPGEGGSIWLSWGPGVEGTAPITAWEPNRRFQWTEARGPVKLAIDFHLEARSGGTVVRLVQSGFGDGPEWDGEFHMLEGGWSYFLRHLQWYLEKHPGMPRDLIAFRAPLTMTRSEAYARLMDALRPLNAEPLVERPETHQVAFGLGDMNDAILFLEMEPAESGTRAGFWLSTYGLAPARLATARQQFSDLYRGALGIAPDEAMA